MKNWVHKTLLSTLSLDLELNDLANIGYEIFKIWRVNYDSYEIVAFKELSVKKEI